MGKLPEALPLVYCQAITVLSAAPTAYRPIQSVLVGAAIALHVAVID